MSNKSSGRPEEQEAVRTTIVGGRPPGSGKSLGPIPRGIEVLVKKAAVDPAFRLLLLNQRAAAAEAIGLRLEPAEAMMLNGVAAPQLESIIKATKVHPAHRGALLGKVAAVMLAAMGLTQAGCDNSQQPESGAVAGSTAQTRPGATGDAVEPTDDNKVVVQIGARVELPATTQGADRPDVIAPVAGSVPFRQQIQRAATIDRPPATTQASNTVTVQIIRGAMVDRPVEVQLVAGDRADAPPERPEQMQVVDGIRPIRPTERVAGVRADRAPDQLDPAPATMPATTQSLAVPQEPVSPERVETFTVAGLVIMPERAPAPATTQSTRPITKGLTPDRPERVEPIEGVRPDRPPATEEQP